MCWLIDYYQYQMFLLITGNQTSGIFIVYN
nr:MAG TPA: hypothetical protein [Crassvirales sp.]